jgi:hypothetical protein
MVMEENHGMRIWHLWAMHGVHSLVAVTIEAKADETFGLTVAQTLADAMERLLENPRSRGLRRVEDLGRALLLPRGTGQPHIGALRYQLLTGVAGTLAYAADVGASTAVLIVHEFVTDKTADEKHEQNEADYRGFLHRLGGTVPSRDKVPRLLGPFSVPGAPLFGSGAKMLIGKATTNLRDPLFEARL